MERETPIIVPVHPELSRIFDSNASGFLRRVRLSGPLDEARSEAEFVYKVVLLSADSLMAYDVVQLGTNPVSPLTQALQNVCAPDRKILSSACLVRIAQQVHPDRISETLEELARSHIPNRTFLDANEQTAKWQTINNAAFRLGVSIVLDAAENNDSFFLFQFSPHAATTQTILKDTLKQVLTTKPVRKQVVKNTVALFSSLSEVLDTSTKSPPTSPLARQYRETILAGDSKGSRQISLAMRFAVSASRVLGTPALVNNREIHKQSNPNAETLLHWALVASKLSHE